MNAWKLLALSSFALVCGGCVVTTVPPPPAPRAEMPPIDVPPPSEGGLATVILSTDVPARVVRVTYGQVGNRVAEIDDLLCVETPCSFTLPYGDHELRITGTKRNLARRSDMTISVRRTPEVINHVLGETKQQAGNVIGSGIAVLGLLSVGAGLAISASAKENRIDPSLGVPFVAGGLLVGIVGLVVALADPAKRHHGSTTQWTPAPEPPSASASLPAPQGRTYAGGVGFSF